MSSTKQRNKKGNKGIISEHEKLRRSRIHYIYKTRGMTIEWKKAKIADKSFDGYIKAKEVQRDVVSMFGFTYQVSDAIGGLKSDKKVLATDKVK